METILSIHTHVAAALALTLWWFCRSVRPNDHLRGTQTLTGGLALAFLYLSVLDLIHAPLGWLDVVAYSAWRKGGRLILTYVLVLTWVDVLCYRRQS